ncbi:MAG: SEC-C metal-binding domain-containing protein, partial [Phycisphaerae bacterium]|nr:SEC-C metal-binding domain-containing protein [Phycisphaerae bacterium]
IHAETPDDLGDLENSLRNSAKEEAVNTITITLGEYMDVDTDRQEWDLRGLSSWAMSRFGVNISQNQLRKMTPEEVAEQLNQTACGRIDQIDLTPLAVYLAEDFAVQSLAEWAEAKFAVTVTTDELGGREATAEDVRTILIEKVEQLYRRREIEYPVEYALDMTLGQTGPENVYAIGQLVAWANRKYEGNLSTDDFHNVKPQEIYQSIVGLSEQWSAPQRLEQSLRQGVGDNPTVEQAIEFAKVRFDTDLTPADFNGDILGRLSDVGRRFLRREVTELERYILLQIYDSSWMDHLLSMDHLKSGIGLRGFAEQDPRVAYKREGANQFQEMLAAVRDKVTDMIFKVRLTAGQEMANVYQISNMVHEQLTGYDHLTQGMDAQDPGAPQKVETIKRDVPKVGRNDPCPCGSGKKYKKCCGRV